MVRRFFVAETMSGVTTSGGYYSGQKPEYIRLASTMKLTVQLDPEQKETIRRPYLYVSYVEKEVALLTAQETMKVTFYIDYYEEFSAAWEAVKGVMIGA